MAMDTQKLPKWAQEHILLLERRLAEAREERDMAYAAVNGGGASAVVVSGHNTRPDIYLPDRDVDFRIDDQNYITVRLMHHFKTGKPTGVHVRTNWRQLIAKPEAANTLFISVERN